MTLTVVHRKIVESQHFSVLTSTYPCYHEHSCTSLLHIPNIYHDGQEVLWQECVKSRSANMSIIIAVCLLHFPAALDLLVARPQPFNFSLTRRAFITDRENDLEVEHEGFFKFKTSRWKAAPF